MFRRGRVGASGTPRRIVATAIVGCVMVATASAQSGDITVTGPAGALLREGTPRFTIAATGFTQADLPLQLRLQVALSPDFAAPLWADTTVVGSSATIVVPRLLPPLVNVWWRVIARTAQGQPVISNADGPRRSPPWLTLISPNNLNGSTVDSPRPEFLWTSAALLSPVAPWRYTIVISRSSDGLAVLTRTLSETVYRPFVDLEYNTSYRWAVSAVAGTGDTVRVMSASSFVITSPNAPIATVMFQSFPTPFPTERLNATCIWFDLRKQSDVRLEVLDLRGNRVARILPGRGLGGTLPPGRYGRATIGSDAGCDERLSWDGTDDRGRVVRPGVYLIRFTGDGYTNIKKVLFRGR